MRRAAAFAGLAVRQICQTECKTECSDIVQLLSACQTVKPVSWAKSVGQIVRQSVFWSQADFLEELRQLAPDLCVTAAYGNILPQVMSHCQSLAVTEP